MASVFIHFSKDSEVITSLFPSRSTSHYMDCLSPCVLRMRFVSDVPQRLRSELLRITGATEKDWVDKRMKQIQDYWHLDRYQRGAKVMLKIATGFGLTSNFDALKVLSDAVSIV